jgi:hypothetical protein
MSCAPSTRSCTPLTLPSNVSEVSNQFVPIGIPATSGTPYYNISNKIVDTEKFPLRSIVSQITGQSADDLFIDISTIRIPHSILSITVIDETNGNIYSCTPNVTFLNNKTIVYVDLINFTIGNVYTFFMQYY